MYTTIFTVYDGEHTATNNNNNDDKSLTTKFYVELRRLVSQCEFISHPECELVLDTKIVIFMIIHNNEARIQASNHNNLCP